MPDTCPCGTGFQPTVPQFGDGANELLWKIANSVSVLAGGSVASGSAGTTPSFNTAPDITVLVAGTAVQGLSIPTPRGVKVTARSTNTGSCYAGGSNVTNGTGGFRGMELLPAGMSQELPISNLNQLYINADNAGDRVGVVIL